MRWWVLLAQLLLPDVLRTLGDVAPKGNKAADTLRPSLGTLFESARETHMNVESDRPLSETPTQELVARLVRQSKMLVQAEVQLARTELLEDLKREVRMIEGLGIAALCALVAVNLLLVALVLGLSLDSFIMPGWAAAVTVGAVVLIVGAVAGALGWAMRVREPLAKTRKTLKEDVQWAKQRMA